MCGISAVYGERAVIKALVISLNQQNRGRQGSGIAYTCNHKLQVRKAPCSTAEFIVNYLKDLEDSNLMSRRVAISHNRQPSAGQVSLVNTHPFEDCLKRFALIHNGHAFVTRKRELLIQDGHDIQGQTDSEALTHILEDYYDKEKDLKKALRQLAVNDLSGAVIVLARNGIMYATKTGSWPLWIVKHKGEVYLASEKQAIASLGIPVDKAFEPKPCQVVEVMGPSVRVYYKPKEERINLTGWWNNYLKLPYFNKYDEIWNDY
jgi:glucosamine--fructose-6-phosphate aminotransferase (isomerizing)